MKNNARAFFSFWHFEDVLVLSTTWNDLFCSCVDDVGIWWQMFNFVFLCPKRWFQFNWRMVRTHFSRIMTLNNWKNNCRNAKLDFQMTFSLPSTSCLLKLPIFMSCRACSKVREERAKKLIAKAHLNPHHYLKSAVTQITRSLVSMVIQHQWLK